MINRKLVQCVPLAVSMTLVVACDSGGSSGDGDLAIEDSENNQITEENPVLTSDDSAALGDSFSAIMDTLILEEGKRWICRTDPVEFLDSAVMTIAFQADGATSVIFSGIADLGDPLPRTPQSHPGSWSTGYPVEDRELHINGTFSLLRFSDPFGVGDNRIGPDIFENQYFNSWQIILQDIDILDEPNFLGGIFGSPENTVSFTSTMYYIDSITDISFPITCSSLGFQRFDYVPYER